MPAVFPDISTDLGVPNNRLHSPAAGAFARFSLHLRKEIDVLVDREAIHSDEGALYRRRRPWGGGEDQPPAAVNQRARGRPRGASVSLQDFDRPIEDLPLLLSDIPAWWGAKEGIA